MSLWDELNSDDNFLEPLYLCVECASHIPPKEGETFPACERCGNKESAKFVFPKQIPGEYHLAILRISVENDGKIPLLDLVPLMPLLFGQRTYKRLQELFEPEAIGRIHNVLLKAYDVIQFDVAEGDDPLGKEEATPQSSTTRSSRTGGRSKRTSTGSSTSKTSKPNSKSNRGAGASKASKP